ncbi:molybdopterin-synthase adenylyltransferase MoeB [Shewanella surugensis]|uniref:Molybdopterin-synthase adenylyltransferase MoeB n=1 Tax=Shewanella surugensis TaxID=212020 RepID=A0ABT0L8M0_9GAMM|nr:molybdopterin-synthase adenylyltransferase MoeB [Shewanella surugensis]MCL1124053.1 molybdopterin-synthase adenylyltransferase MoeB [Shewanella surugensis]
MPSLNDKTRVAHCDNQDELSDAELLRYDRQIAIKAVDIEGQEKLKQAKILVIGLGGLGCAASQYLAVAGVGHLTLIDFDVVSESNLQRQILHCDSNINELKVDSAKQTLAKLNPYIHINTIARQLDDEKMKSIIDEHDLVIDCTDNVSVREQVNQACFIHNVPLVSAAAIRMEGMITVFNYKENTPCYRCFSQLFGEQVLSCVESGILAPVVGIIGSMQALESIKLLLDIGKDLVGRLLFFDAMTMECREMKLLKQAHCSVCGG